jgi:ech hydrogenase subunit D
MIEEQEMVEIDKHGLIEMVAALRSSGYRLVQICATTTADHYEMNYSFDKDRQFKNIRFTVPPGETVPSISLIYSNAFLYENEIQDLFGITIEHMVTDYHSTLYRVRTPAPFSVQTSKPEGGPDSGSVSAGNEVTKEDQNG